MQEHGFAGNASPEGIGYAIFVCREYKIWDLLSGILNPLKLGDVTLSVVMRPVWAKENSRPIVRKQKNAGRELQ